MESRKMAQINLSAGQEERCRELICEHGAGGRGGWDELESSTDIYHCRWWLQPWNWKMLTPWKKSYDQPR